MKDTHNIVLNADFSQLDALYEGKKLYFGDLHCHSNSGGTSDGKKPIADFVDGMKKLGVDFASIVDHRQMRHMFLDAWDDNYFICGSEPGTRLDGCDRPSAACSLHYLMVFPDKYGLQKVLDRYPRFHFKGDSLTGEFSYPCFTPEEFTALAEYIYSIGGLLTHAHPKQVMESDNPLHYYFGDKVPLETVYAFDPNNAAMETSANRDLWVTLLKMGKRMHTYGCSDTHSEVRNTGLTALYCSEHTGKEALSVWRTGNVTAGAVGIKMSIDSTPMGSSVKYSPGRTLYIKTDAFHPAYLKERGVFTLTVYTDTGVAYQTQFDGSAQAIAIEVRERMFYRVEITDHSGTYIAISNPIWLDK